MLAEADTLLTIAEIGIAFAGFAALAGVIGRSQSRDGARIDLERLRAVIYTSLLIVVVAVIPVVVAKYQVHEATVWRISSIVTLVLNWAAVFVVARHASRSGFVPAVDRFANWINIPVEVAAELPIIANVLGVFPDNAPAFYFTFLIIAICQAAFLFLRLLDSLFSHEARE